MKSSSYFIIIKILNNVMEIFSDDKDKSVEAFLKITHLIVLIQYA